MQYETSTHGTVLRTGGVAMREAWERLIVGPLDADRSVLLLPGGANAARSFDLVMAEPALSGVRLVATTLPGMAGAPVSAEVSIPAVARRAGELARENACDVVVGFSYGATIALDMVLSGHFQGPVVLLGLSPDDPGRVHVLPLRGTGVTEGGQVADGHPVPADAADGPICQDV